jgi:hypothetical protein
MVKEIRRSLSPQDNKLASLLIKDDLESIPEENKENVSFNGTSEENNSQESNGEYGYVYRNLHIVILLRMIWWSTIRKPIPM